MESRDKTRLRAMLLLLLLVNPSQTTGVFAARFIIWARSLERTQLGSEKLFSAVRDWLGRHIVLHTVTINLYLFFLFFQERKTEINRVKVRKHQRLELSGVSSRLRAAMLWSCRSEPRCYWLDYQLALANETKPINRSSLFECDYLFLCYQQLKTIYCREGNFAGSGFNVLWRDNEHPA